MAPDLVAQAPQSLRDFAMFLAGVSVALYFGIQVLKAVSVRGNGHGKDKGMIVAEDPRVVGLLEEIRDGFRTMRERSETARVEEARHFLLTEQAATVIKGLEHKLFICPVVPQGAALDPTLFLPSPNAGKE